VSSEVKVMLCPSSSGPYLENLARELRVQGAKVSFVPWFGKQTPYSVASLLWARLRGYRVLHLNWMPFNRCWQLRLLTRLTKALGIRVVWTVHNLSPHRVQFGSEQKDRAAMRRLAEWADQGVVHSERTREAAGAVVGDLPLEVIHHGSYADRVRLLDPAEARRGVDVPEDRFAVLFLGPNRWNKGIRAYLETVSRLPDRYVGVVAGACPDPAIRRLVLSYKGRYPSKFVLDLRRLSADEVARFYAASDLLFMPFESVTTSGTVIEALSYGRPVVTVDKGDMYEWVRDGETGYLVESVDDAVARIERLDREEAARMGRRGRELAAQRTWAEAARRYLEIYRSVQ